ncbi:chemosensory pili system protein ChpA (sensor histidine kinase/response regulator)/two-component system, OmpR family, phosphate regulon response regulator PhoB/two-component system, OmpR family, alkaline phosphatase synthesis response regulator PhoP [bacterium A37T11]|nr:chemosensory pili system protein ChpA (sensor histidine kinase/response regulator)/two-component system, OmpR family, phosphate regulon response regulator PhoB/two-component system, OmpR family, alkaline phosphatase synthesis response regulator PhoP [bacterium A37T11]
MKKILYIEDDAAVAEVVLEILEFEDYDVITDSGKFLHSHLKNHQIGLVLVDEGLSWCWGSDLVKEIKANPDTAGIPVVMISSANEIDKIAERCGANAFVRKPFDMYDVIDIVNEYYKEA